MNKITVKSEDEIKVMKEGGRRLNKVKAEVKQLIKVGISAGEIENKATFLIKKNGGRPSFKMVPGYHWSTCVNVNEGVVHGIPLKGVVFQKGDIVSVDIGFYYKGFHTDTSFTEAIESEESTRAFLNVGKRALSDACLMAKVGSRIYDISSTIEGRITRAGFSPVKSLVGHGIGRDLHEEPPIPCFTLGDRKNSPEMQAGMVIAIEVMYTMGAPDLKIEKDGWTISTSDGKISALFEDTVAVTVNGPVVLT